MGDLQPVEQKPGSTGDQRGWCRHGLYRLRLVWDLHILLPSDHAWDAEASVDYLSGEMEVTVPHPYKEYKKRYCLSSAPKKISSKSGMSSSGTCPILGLRATTYHTAGDSWCFAEEKSQLATAAWLQFFSVPFPRCLALCADSRLPRFQV